MRRVQNAGQRAGILVLLAIVSSAFAQRASPFAALDRPDAETGYLARLLINEVPFPGERGWKSVEDSKAAMLQILWVLHGRVHLIPAGYLQIHIAGVRSTSIIDIITGTGGRRQCEGFYRDESGRFVTTPRVEERVGNLLRIANSGGKPGRFAELANFGQELARAYLRDGIRGADRYAMLHAVGDIQVTGRAYAWMTNINDYRPGGNFVAIPDASEGALGGNRFFTLRKVPR